MLPLGLCCFFVLLRETNEESNSFPVGYLGQLHLCLNYDGISDGSEEKILDSLFRK